ncbi:hypothetical protein Y1Q_0018856 [Alligator mississippiensis]|uniref:Uncharacterized protein n=1 Tax=Alligator mississippiensis TaxID=8496 RepID=A0A151M334_ALLMI|nr:hypothetical protein Y1Q_0018856 [Alligator mississippiensis]
MRIRERTVISGIKDEILHFRKGNHSAFCDRPTWLMASLQLDNTGTRQTHIHNAELHQKFLFIKQEGLQRPAGYTEEECVPSA